MGVAGVYWRRRVTALLVGAAVSGCGVAGDKAGGNDVPEPVVLSLAHSLDVAEFRPFLDQVDRLSRGAVRIEPRAVPRTADKDDDATVQYNVLAGHTDLGVVSTTVSPLWLDSLAKQEQAFRDGWFVVTMDESNGLRGVGALPGPLIRPAGVTRPLLGPRSYRDVRVAMRPDFGLRMILTNMGTIPVPHNLRGEEGIIAEAVAAPLTDIASNVYDGVVTTVTANVALGFRILIIFAGTTEKRDLLVAAAKAALPASFALRRAEDVAAVSALCRRGRVDFVTAGPEDLAALRQELESQPPADPPATDAVPADIPSCADVAGDTTSTLLDGVYEVTTDRGTHRITLARGRFDDAGQRGGYTVHGDVLVMNYPSSPGAIAYRWTLYDDELTLSPVADRNSPPALRSAPWRRVGDAPVAPRTPADGVYELTTATGEFRWTLDRGQLHQSRDDGAIWARASYTITGDVLTATYSEIGGEPLASAPVRPGETVRYRWNLYRGWLRLSPVDDSPTVFATAWRRVGDAP
jgi:hypothetical protein